MRKLLVIGAAAAVIMTVAVGAIFAQEATPEAETQVAATAWLGIGLVENEGQVTIARVKSGSPADAADLLIGDVITAFNDTPITTGTELVELVAAAAPGDTATLTVTRNGESVSIEVTLGTTPTHLHPGRDGRGMTLPTNALSAAELLLNADLQEAESGYEVVNVFAGRNPFALEVGDVVTTLNAQAITELDLEALQTELSAMESPILTLEVTRDGEALTLDSTAFGGRFGAGRGDDFGRGGGRGGRPSGNGRGGDNGGGFGFEFGAPPSEDAPVAPSGTQA